MSSFFTFWPSPPHSHAHAELILEHVKAHARTHARTHTLQETKAVCDRCSYLLIASASSMAGSLLVEIFGFPLVTTLQMGHMCFVTALATGNWGMEVSIFLHAQLPSFAPALPLRTPSLS